jgi:flagellar hook-associated protein 2
MAQESQPLTQLETKQSTLQAKDDEYDNLLTYMEKVQDAAEELKTPDTVADREATTTDDDIVKVEADSDALVGNYEVVVQQLARAQVTTSTTTYADKNTTVVATGGTLKIGDSELTISGDMTLSDLASAINDMDDGVAKATVVQANGTYQLVLTGRETGADNDFTVDTSGMTGSTLAFNSTNSMNAQDAIFTVNNVTINSSSNEVDDAIPGTTLDLVTADPDTTVAIEISQNVDSTESKIQDFVDAYNELVSYLTTQRTSAVSGDDNSIGSESVVRSLRSTLSGLLSKSVTSGSLKNLAELGLEFQTDGTLDFDQDTFEDVADDYSTDIERLLAGTSSTDGVFDGVYNALKAYTQSGGIIAETQDNLDDQVDKLDDKIADMEERLALKKAQLQKEYAAADAILTQLNSQSSALSALS